MSPKEFALRWILPWYIYYVRGVTRRIDLLNKRYPLPFKMKRNCTLYSRSKSHYEKLIFDETKKFYFHQFSHLSLRNNSRSSRSNYSRYTKLKSIRMYVHDNRWKRTVKLFTISTKYFLRFIRFPHNRNDSKGRINELVSIITIVSSFVVSSPL